MRNEKDDIWESAVRPFVPLSSPIAVGPLTIGDGSLALIAGPCSIESESLCMEIGEHLVLSLNTVNFHLRNLYQKLGVRSRTQAIKVGQQVGLLDVAKHPIRVA